MGDVQITVTMTLGQAALLILAPIAGAGFAFLAAWADEQRQIEHWLDRRRTRTRDEETEA